jgi:hypothetical protein
MQAAVTVIRTWANSWTTSARYHDDKLEHCCFGCVQEADSLEHYLACWPLWRTTSTATSIPYASDVLGRLCIATPCRENLFNLVVASGTYHTLKMQYLLKVREAKAMNEWEDFNDLALAIASNLAREWSNLNSAAGGATARSNPDVFASATLTANGSSATASQMMLPSFVSAGVATPRVPVAKQDDAWKPASADVDFPEDTGRDFCELECSDLPPRQHHPCCSQFDRLLNPVAARAVAGANAPSC